MFHKPINSDLYSVNDIALHNFTLRFFMFGTPTVIFHKNYDNFVRNFMKSLSFLQSV